MVDVANTMYKVYWQLECGVDIYQYGSLSQRICTILWLVTIVVMRSIWRVYTAPCFYSDTHCVASSSLQLLCVLGDAASRLSPAPTLQSPPAVPGGVGSRHTHGALHCREHRQTLPREERCCAGNNSEGELCRQTLKWLNC